MKSLYLIPLAMLAAGCAQAPMAPAVQPSTMAPKHDPAKTDREIAFHLERVKNDPKGALGWAMLSEAYLAKSRERDDDSAAIEAESAARKSLEARRRNNSRAATRLSQALLEQHRFSEGLEAAKLAVELEPDSESAKRLVAEIHLELGNYGDFKKSLAKLNAPASDPSGAVLLARWEELQGNNKEAERLWRQAAKSAEIASVSSPGTTAWFKTKLGEALFRFGKIEESEKTLNEALQLDPGNYKALAEMTRLKAGTGDWAQVIKWGEKTLRTAKMTDIQGLVADGYRLTGNPAKAEEIYSQIDRANATPEMLAMKNHKTAHSHAKSATKRHTHDRLYSMFLSDHARHPFLAHHAAEEDLGSRKDIYAYDTFAWGTYQYWKNIPASVTGEGDALLDEAEAAMEKALSTGVKDAKVLFHAGMIFWKQDRTRAAGYLREALAINPHFHALQAQEAQSALATLSQ